MSRKDALHAVDHYLRDLMEVPDLPMGMGGKVVVLGGYFRQVLLVVPTANRMGCYGSLPSQSQQEDWPRARVVLQVVVGAG